MMATSAVAPTRPDEQRRRRERVCSVASGEVVHVRAKVRGIRGLFIIRPRRRRAREVGGEREDGAMAIRRSVPTAVHSPSALSTARVVDATALIRPAVRGGLWSLGAVVKEKRRAAAQQVD